MADKKQTGMEKRVIYNAAALGAACVVPQMLLVFLFFYWPTCAAFVWAFTYERPWGGGLEWAGFENFRGVFADGAYWQAIVRNGVFTLSTTILSIGIGGLFALFCDRHLKFYSLHRTILVWPYAVVAPASALAFHFIFSPKAGIFAFLVRANPALWNPDLNGVHAMVMIILCFSWKYIAYSFIFFTAGLQAIPRSVIEAAAMDGARPWRRMLDIQIPLLTPTLFFLIVINIAESFQDSLGVIDIMTDGGPGKATELLVYKNYFDSFRGLDYSGGAAQSLIMIFIMIGITLAQFRFLERRVHYHG